MYDKGSYRNYPFVKETIGLRISYRQYNCCDLCIKKYGNT